MEDHTVEIEEAPSKEVRRRLSYPVRELTYFTDVFVPKIYTDLGVNSFNSREHIAKVIGLEVNSIKQLLSSAQLYGLLEIKHGTGYKITQLFIKIHKHINETEKQEGIVEALRACDLFNKIIEDFDGHVLTKNAIANSIIRASDVKDSSAEKAAEIFLANLKEYNLIAPDGSINFKKPLAATTNTKDKIEDQEKPPANPPANPPAKHPPKVEEGITIIPIPLKSSNKKAYLHIPDDFTEEDLARISKFVEALK